jgi:hypothetical protein
MPFLDESAELVTGDADTVEVGEAIKAFNFLNLKFDDSPGKLVLVLLVKVSVGNRKDAASQRISRDVLSSGFVARRQSRHSNFEKTRCTYIVPLLFDEGMSTQKTQQNVIRY